MSGPPKPGHRDEGYERSDVNIRSIALFTLAVVVATALAMALMVWLYNRYERRQQRAEEASIPATRLADERPRTPAGPVLQGAPGSEFELQDPLVEMEALRRAQDEHLRGSGWADRNAGVVRIPIERAKELILERGLPVRPTAAGKGEVR